MPTVRLRHRRHRHGVAVRVGLLWQWTVDRVSVERKVEHGDTIPPDVTRSS